MEIDDPKSSLSRMGSLLKFIDYLDDRTPQGGIFFTGPLKDEEEEEEAELKSRGREMIDATPPTPPPTPSPEPPEEQVIHLPKPLPEIIFDGEDDPLSAKDQLRPIRDIHGAIHTGMDNPCYNSEEIHDHYTPRYVRGHGKKRQVLCEKCFPSTWIKSKTELWYHTQFVHGISSKTKRPFPAPAKIANTFGLCELCGHWIALSSAQLPSYNWFRHHVKECEGSRSWKK